MNTSRTVIAALATGVLHSCAEPPLVDFQRVTVLSRERTVVVEKAIVEGNQLWVPEGVATAVNGFELRPEGLCAGELCIPLPTDGSWTRDCDRSTYLDVTALAQTLEQASVSDDERRIWSFSRAPALRRALVAGRAPDFELPDRDGAAVRLSDFRGKKVLLLTWASW